MKKVKKRLIKLSFFLLVLIITINNPISARIFCITVAKINGVDSVTFYKLIKAESSFRTFAYSKKKAIGLGQIKKETSQFMHDKIPPVFLWNPIFNLYISSKYYKYLHSKFNDNLSLTLAAYNWGETNVLRLIKKNKINIKSSENYSFLFKDNPETYEFIINIMN